MNARHLILSRRVRQLDLAGYKTRLHGNTVRIFDSRGQAIYTHQLFTDLPRDIGQIRKRRHDTNLLRED